MIRVRHSAYSYVVRMRGSESVWGYHRLATTPGSLQASRCTNVIPKSYLLGLCISNVMPPFDRESQITESLRHSTLCFLSMLVVMYTTSIINYRASDGLCRVVYLLLVC